MKRLEIVQHMRMVLFGAVMMVVSGCGGDGGGTGGPTGAACQSNCPTAEAGPEQAVLTGSQVTLDGSGSASGTNGLITYQWTLTSKPAGSAATLAGATTARPSFTADVAGTYAARLVVHEGGVSSTPDTVTITCGTGNLAPMADAGRDRTERLGIPVTLDGTGSRDPNGTPITYAWRFVTQPSGSRAVLLTATSKTPSFTPQVAGLYTLALTVSDGTLTSPPDEVGITVMECNCPPGADAGPDQTVTTGRLVTLTGAGSTDPNDDPLTYSWRFQSKPDGSSATLETPASINPTFRPDLAGFYVISLVVSDGTLTSAPDSVVIEAKLPGMVDAVLQAYVKPSNPFGGTRDAVDFSPGNQFGFNVAINGDTLAVGGPTEGGGSGAVYVFTRRAGGWSQQAYVKASNARGGSIDEGLFPGFGTSVAISGDTLAVGAPGENGCATGVNGNQTNDGCGGTGAVYVFTRTNGIWAQQAYVKASNNNADPSAFFAGFGRSLALDGDTLAVGAHGEYGCATGINGNQTNTGCVSSGAVYVFTRTAGDWSQQAYVKASNTGGGSNDSGDLFGSSVALAGNTLAVGATQEDSCATGINGDQTNNGCKNAGAVYVFTRTNAIWSQQAYVKASNAEDGIGDGDFVGDLFGSSVALAGDTLAVGATQEDSCARGINGDQTNNGCRHAGAVYVFTRTNAIWSQQAYVKASNTRSGGELVGSDLFGASVALSGDILAVGAPNEDSCATGVNGDQANVNCGFSGAAYLFRRTVDTWSQQSYVKASNTDRGDRFGASVALSSETLAVGAPGESSCSAGVNGNQADNNCYLVGAVYVYIGQ